MGRLKYQFDQSGELEKILVQVRLWNLLIFAAITIIIGVVLSYSENKGIQGVLDIWPLYVGFIVFAILMQVLGLILTKYMLPKQIEKLIK